VSGLFALLYGLFRFAVEFVREPDVQIGFIAFDWLTMGQILSLPLIAVGIVLLWMSRRAPTVAAEPASGGGATR
jgi:phosphatidylglycerol:prolipoprotein diacylglycerol transferase